MIIPLLLLVENMDVKTIGEMPANIFYSRCINDPRFSKLCLGNVTDLSYIFDKMNNYFDQTLSTIYIPRQSSSTTMIIFKIIHLLCSTNRSHIVYVGFNRLMVNEINYKFSNILSTFGLDKEFYITKNRISCNKTGSVVNMTPLNNTCFRGHSYDYMFHDNVEYSNYFNRYIDETFPVMFTLATTTTFVKTGNNTPNQNVMRELEKNYNIEPCVFKWYDFKNLNTYWRYEQIHRMGIDYFNQNY